MSPRPVEVDGVFARSYPARIDWCSASITTFRSTRRASRSEVAHGSDDKSGAQFRAFGHEHSPRFVWERGAIAGIAAHAVRTACAHARWRCYARIRAHD